MFSILPMSFENPKTNCHILFGRFVKFTQVNSKNEGFFEKTIGVQTFSETGKTKSRRKGINPFLLFKLYYSTSSHNLFFRVRKNGKLRGDRQVMGTYNDFRKLKPFLLIF